MGRYKLKLSNLMPNSWFYKLRRNKSKGIIEPRTQTDPKSFPETTSQDHHSHKHLFISNRPSYYYSTSDRGQRRTPTATSSVSTGCSSALSNKSKTTTTSTSNTTLSFSDLDEAASQLQLRPIVTKQGGEKEKQQGKCTPRRSPPGLRRSPRIAARKKKTNQTKKRVLPGSFAVVKSSSDPYRDFRDSMVEMIEENDIRTSKDLEEMLACYLSLNSTDYHHVIVKVFEQIWFEFAHLRF